MDRIVGIYMAIGIVFISFCTVKHLSQRRKILDMLKEDEIIVELKSRNYFYAAVAFGFLAGVAMDIFCRIDMGQNFISLVPKSLVLILSGFVGFLLLKPVYILTQKGVIAGTSFLPWKDVYIFELEHSKSGLKLKIGSDAKSVSVFINPKEYDLILESKAFENEKN